MQAERGKGGAMRRNLPVKLGTFALMFLGMLSAVFYYRNQEIPNVGEKTDEVISQAQIFTPARTVSAEIPIIKIGNETVYYPEFEFYLLATKKDYEALLGDKVWDIVQNGRSVEDELKSDIIEEIARLKVIVNQAKSEGYSLTTEEEEEIKRAAKEQLKGIDPMLKAKYYLDEELITGIYLENYMATKFFDGFSSEAGVKGDVAKKLFKDAYNSWENAYTAEIYWENIDRIDISGLDIDGE